jgi:hypothetical protein
MPKAKANKRVKGRVELIDQTCFFFFLDQTCFTPISSSFYVCANETN